MSSTDDGDVDADDEDLYEISWCLEKLLRRERSLESRRDALRALIHFAEEELKKLAAPSNQDQER